MRPSFPGQCAVHCDWTSQQQQQLCSPPRMLGRRGQSRRSESRWACSPPWSRYSPARPCCTASTGCWGSALREISVRSGQSWGLLLTFKLDRGDVRLHRGEGGAQVVRDLPVVQPDKASIINNIRTSQLSQYSTLTKCSSIHLGRDNYFFYSVLEL